MKDIIEVTLAELANIFRSLKSNIFCGIDLTTDPRMLKKHRDDRTPNPYLGMVEKVQTWSGSVGFDYESGMQRLEIKEGLEPEFEAQSLPPYQKPDPTTRNLVLNKTTDEPYLRFKVQSAKTAFLFNGVEIDRETLKPYLPVSSKPKTQAHIDADYIVRTPKLSSVKRVRMLGKEYVVVAEALASEKVDTKQGEEVSA